MANGSREDVPYEPDLWIHDCLMLLKTPERIDAETGELAIRPIGVLCAINPAHEYDSYLAEEMPAIQAHKETLPVTAEYMIISDAADGYHACVVEKSSRKYLCVGYYSAVKKRYRIMQCVRMPQGLKSSGGWYPAWVNHGFNRCFGYAWRSWVLTHVDDLMTTTDSEARCWGRFRCIVSAQEAMGIKQSPKVPPSCRKSHTFVGLTWVMGKVRASDTVRLSMRMACEMRPKTVKQIRRVVGLIKANSTCLNFGASGVLRFGELLDVMQQAVATGTWTSECEAAQAEILDKEAQVDWVLWDPTHVVSGTRSLLILTDASSYQLGICLFTIAKPNAALILPSDVEDRDIAGVLDISPIKLSSSEAKYHASEKELTGGVRGCEKYGKFITTCTTNYAADGIAKVALATDSTVSHGSWKVFRLPHIANFDYLNAKAMRMFSWVDKISYTRLWPMALLHFPGELITLPDFVSRTALFFFEQARKRRDEALLGGVEAGVRLHEDAARVTSAEVNV